MVNQRSPKPPLEVRVLHPPPAGTVLSYAPSVKGVRLVEKDCHRRLRYALLTSQWVQIPTGAISLVYHAYKEI